MYANRVYRFSASGSVLGKWGRPFQLASRSEIAVDAEGHVYAISGESGAQARVIKLGRDGATLASWGREGHGSGELFDPIALAVDHAGRVYVACWGGGKNPRVVVYDARGTFVHQWDVASGSAPWLRMPTAIAIDAQGIVYVTDLKQDRVHTLPALGR